LIDASIVSLVTVIGLVTIGVSAYMILYNHGFYAWFRGGRLLSLFRARSEDEPEPPVTTLQGHVIVVGMNSLGRQLVRELHERGETVLAVDTDPYKLAGLPTRTLTGSIDHQAVIEDAALAQAKLAVSALQIEDANLLLSYRCKQLGVPVAVHAFDRSVIDSFRHEGVDFLINSRARGVARITEELVKTGMIAS
jgi:voltage-gated potassium channel Kch